MFKNMGIVIDSDVQVLHTVYQLLGHYFDK